MGWTGPINTKVRATKSHCNVSQPTHLIHPLDPKIMFWLFHSIWVHLGSFHNCMKLVAKHTELVQLMQKFVPGSRVVIFRNQRTWSTHWTLHSCFSEFHSVWVHLGSFRNCMKLSAKRGELVQLIHKFVPRSHVVILRNERTWSTPLDPKLMFWCLS